MANINASEFIELLDILYICPLLQFSQQSDETGIAHLAYVRFISMNLIHEEFIIKVALSQGRDSFIKSNAVIDVKGHKDIYILYSHNNSITGSLTQ